MDEVTSLRKARPAGQPRKPRAQSVSPDDPDAALRTDFNRQRPMRKPSPDQLPKTMAGNLDLDTLQQQQKALINKRKPK